MSVLIAAVGFGILFAMLSLQNTAPVALQVGNLLLPNVPLFLVILVSLFSGLVIAWMISMFDWFGSRMSLQRKNSQIHEHERELDHLKQRLQGLEMENARLRGEQHRPQVVVDRPQESRVENLWERFKENLSTPRH